MVNINKETITSVIIDVAYKHLVLKNNNVPDFICGTSKILMPEIDVKCEEDFHFYLVHYAFNDNFIIWKFKKPFILNYFLKGALFHIECLIKI